MFWKVKTPNLYYPDECHDPVQITQALPEAGQGYTDLVAKIR